MKKEPKHNARRILLIDRFITPAYAFGEYPTVFIATVATIDDDDGKPRNWTYPYSFDRIKNDVGGFRITAFLTNEGRILSHVKAPEVHSSNPSEYMDTAKAINAMNARDTDLNETLGYPANTLESLIRQILVLGIKDVYERNDDNKHHSMLNRGDWVISSIGKLSNSLRSAYGDCVRSSSSAAAEVSLASA